MDVDTIVALATAPGPAAIAVVRLSGSRSHEILARIAPEREATPPRTAVLTRIVDPSTGEAVDHGLVTHFVAPFSYTGEDAVEISGHGGWLSPALVMDACLAAGARMAMPGEFTQRAYLNGRLDLVQAEAVLDLIEARSPALHRAALHQVERGLSERVSTLRERLVHLEALLAHHLDFPEEDDAPVPIERIAADAEEISGLLNALLRTAPQGELLRDGALTVLAGRPNSGKSSLFNALLGEERAIVTEVPGTTRDAIEAVVSVGGFPFRLVDTAGLRQSDERVEILGIEVARRYLARADLVLLCSEANDDDDGALEKSFATLLEGRACPVIRVRTKTDLCGDAASDRGELEVGVSVITGDGLDRLTALLPAVVYAGLVEQTEPVVLTRARQTRAVRSASDELAAFRAALAGGVPAELASTHLRSAETALEELLGVISPEDVLDALFREFCIGK